MTYNLSTFKLLETSLAHQKPLVLLRKRTSLWCPTHQRTERVMDSFANGECRLACGCRRSVVTDPAVISKFETEKIKRAGQKQTGWAAGSMMTVEDASAV
jgi:hypothetical protein